MSAKYRYFKATNGERTYFRRTGSFAFKSARLDGPYVSFSKGEVSPGAMAAVEIDKAEYLRLVAMKAERTRHSAPWQSYVLNSQLA